MLVALSISSFLLTFLVGSASWIIPFDQWWFYPMEGIPGLAFAVLLNSVLAYTVLSYANSVTSPVVVTIFHPLQPLSSAILSSLVLNYDFGVEDAIGALMIMAGSLSLVIVKFHERNLIIHDVSTGQYKSLNRTTKSLDI